MANIRINYEIKAIEISNKFAREASKFGSEQYKELKEARADFPTFEVKVIKTTAKRNDTFKGLTIAYMEKYIGLHDENGSIMKEFNVLRGESNEKDELTAKATYPAYKNGQLNLSEFARVCKMSRTTIYKYIRSTEKEQSL